jgi:hypothetical protein
MNEPPVRSELHELERYVHDALGVSAKPAPWYIQNFAILCFRHKIHKEAIDRWIRSKTHTPRELAHHLPN